MQFRTALLLKVYLFCEFKPEEKLGENRGGGSGDVSPKGKQELEVFVFGPYLVISNFRFKMGVT